MMQPVRHKHPVELLILTLQTMSIIRPVCFLVESAEDNPVKSEISEDGSVSILRADRQDGFALSQRTIPKKAAEHRGYEGSAHIGQVIVKPSSVPAV
jgi:hypothetical protein